MKLHFGAALLLCVAQPLVAAEQEDPIDEIVVGGDAATYELARVEVEHEILVDTAHALKNLPGANVNTNGNITGIAQYRGMYGDRVAVTIDNHTVVSGGPNAMDAPLSYVSPMITEALVIERGIASVSSAPESIGGHVNTQLARGEFGGDQFSSSGFLGSRYSGNGNLSTTAARLTVSNSSHRLSMISEIDNGDDIRSPAGMIRPSALDRKRYDLSYAYADGGNHVVLFAGILDTVDSGTPALPMDIRYIETDLFGSHFLFAVSDLFSLEGRVSANDVAHVMDNFALRSAPPPIRHRETYTTGSGQSFALAGKLDFDRSVLRIGVHGSAAEHDATITNPNNALFRIANFADVQRDLASVFGEWSLERGTTGLEIGVSLRRVETASGEVGATGVMGDGVTMLANRFNNAEKKLSFDDVDAVLKYRLKTGDATTWRFEVARKSRAPSYQELYLWVPMQATGGLADGRTYVGDLGLRSETSSEINIGLETSGSRLILSPQVFYKRIDDFIQGAPTTDAMANMVSMMMTGNPALQFSNTDAEIWGMDVAWAYALTDHLTLDGVATYTRGRRTDIADNLYRLAPLNGSIGISYRTESLTLGTRLYAYAEQDKVAFFNDEQASSGYGLVDLQAAWTASESLRFEAHVGNLFDAMYQDHLAGINRAGGSDVPVGTRLYGAERSFGAGVFLSF